MNEVLRQRIYFRNLALVGLGVFVGFAAMSAVYAYLDRNIQEDRRVFALAFFAGMWCPFIGLSVWMLLAYRRTRLTVNQDTITRVGLVGTKKIGLADVCEARWRTCPVGGSILLRSPNGKLAIAFSEYERSQCQRLIQFLRSALPESIQQNWALFCHKIAIPTVSAREKPQEGEVLLDRRRWDLYFLPTALVVSAVGGYFAWRTGDYSVLRSSIGLFVLWLLMRFRTPARGIICKRISAVPGAAPFIRFLLIWSALGIAGILLFSAFEDQLSHWSLVIGAIAWVTVVLTRAFLQDRRKLQDDLKAAPESMRKWQVFLDAANSQHRQRRLQ